MGTTTKTNLHAKLSLQIIKMVCVAPNSSKSVVKRKSLTVADKLKVIELGSKSVSQRKIASEFNISKTQVQQILKLKGCIQERVNSGTLRLNARNIVDSSKYPEIDSAVYKWFVSVRNPENHCKPLPVSRAILQARALQEAKLRNITEFRASDGWFRNWRKRNGIGALDTETEEISDEEDSSQSNALDAETKEISDQEDSSQSNTVDVKTEQISDQEDSSQSNTLDAETKQISDQEDLSQSNTLDVKAEQISDQEDSSQPNTLDVNDEEMDAVNREINENLRKWLSAAIEQNEDNYRNELCQKLYLHLS